MSDPALVRPFHRNLEPPLWVPAHVRWRAPLNLRRPPRSTLRIDIVRDAHIGGPLRRARVSGCNMLNHFLGSRVVERLAGSGGIDTHASSLRERAWSATTRARDATSTSSESRYATGIQT